MYMNRTKKTVGLLLAVMMVVPIASLCVAASPATPAEEPVEREWTVMLYIGADNEFYENDAGDIVEFTLGQCEKAFVTDLDKDEVVEDVNLVILVDRRSAKDTNGVFIYDNGCFDTPAETWPEMNTSDPVTLGAFINYTVEEYPADKYALVTKSGHAWCGICPDMDDDDAGIESSEYWMMPIDGLRHAIESSEVGHLDMLVLDGDNMASIEAFYELRNAVDVFVGSQQDMPIDGMPYRLMLGDLIDDPTMLPEEFACRIVEDLVLYYNNTAGNKVAMDHLLANSQMAVTGAAFATGEDGINAEMLVGSFMDIASWMLYGLDYEDLTALDEAPARTEWIPTHRPLISSARDFALIGKMADQAGYEWLPDVYSWIQMLSDYVNPDSPLCWDPTLPASPEFIERATAFKAQVNASRICMSQCQILDRSGNSDPHGLNIWFPPTWLQWEDLDMTRSRTYAYDGMGSWVDIPREYYCVDCPLNYSEVGLDFLSDFLEPDFAESEHDELWIQFYDVYYDAWWLENNADDVGADKPKGGI